MQVEFKRKQEYMVNIEETLVYTFNVIAADDEEAENIIAEKFHNGEIALKNGERAELLIGVDGDGWTNL